MNTTSPPNPGIWVLWGDDKSLTTNKNIKRGSSVVINVFSSPPPGYTPTELKGDVLFEDIRLSELEEGAHVTHMPDVQATDRVYVVEIGTDSGCAIIFFTSMDEVEDELKTTFDHEHQPDEFANKDDELRDELLCCLHDTRSKDFWWLDEESQSLVKSLSERIEAVEKPTEWDKCLQSFRNDDNYVMYDDEFDFFAHEVPLGGCESPHPATSGAAKDD